MFDADVPGRNRLDNYELPWEQRKNNSRIGNPELGEDSVLTEYCRFFGEALDKPAYWRYYELVFTKPKNASENIQN